MYFVIRDSGINGKQPAMWAYGETEHKDFINICKYLLSATCPETFIITLFNESGIMEELPLVKYVSRET